MAKIALIYRAKVEHHDESVWTDGRGWFDDDDFSADRAVQQVQDLMVEDLCQADSPYTIGWSPVGCRVTEFYWSDMPSIKIEEGSESGE